MNETCGAIQNQLSLLLYAELSFDDEERVETHLESCAECRAALERERAMHQAFDQVAVEPSPALLLDCRAALETRLEHEPAPAFAWPAARWWDRVLDALAPRLPAAWMKPAGAFALVAAGFVGARLAPEFGAGMFGSMGVAGDPGAARVRYIEPAPDGQVQIVLDETRQRVVVGRMEDDRIRGLVLAATRDPSNAGLRADTVRLLTRRAEAEHAEDVRDALVYAVSNDQNDGVRLTALKGLGAFSRQPEVRGTLARVLQRDPNAEIRMAAMEMLIGGLADTDPRAAMDREMIRVFQELMSREDNIYLRQQAQRALELARASAEIY
jgi:hypothetical protein